MYQLQAITWSNVEPELSCEVRPNILLLDILPVSKQEIECQNFHITLKFAEMPVKFQNKQTFVNPYILATNEIMQDLDQFPIYGQA